MNGINSLYSTQYSQEKVAAENSAAIQRQLAKIAIASNRDEKAAIGGAPKTAAETGVGYVAKMDEDKFHATLEGAKGMVAQNQMKPGSIHTVGLDEGAGDMGAGAAAAGAPPEEAKMAAFRDQALKIAAYLNLVRQVKFAASRSEQIEKVACIVCGGNQCGVCDNLGTLPKFAAEQGLAFADAFSDYVAAGALAKEAEQVAEAMGQDSVDFSRAQQEAVQAQQIVNSNFQGMLGHPPVGAPDWGGLHISQNPVWTMLQPNYHTY